MGQYIRMPTKTKQNLPIWIKLCYNTNRFIVEGKVPKMNDTAMEKWSSLEEIAEHLGVSKDTVYRWIADKQMPAHKVGKLWKFKISEVDEWIIKGDAADK